MFKLWINTELIKKFRQQKSYSKTPICLFCKNKLFILWHWSLIIWNIYKEIEIEVLLMKIVLCFLPWSTSVSTSSTVTSSPASSCWKISFSRKHFLKLYLSHFHHSPLCRRHNILAHHYNHHLRRNTQVCPRHSIRVPLPNLLVVHQGQFHRRLE